VAAIALWVLYAFDASKFEIPLAPAILRNVGAKAAPLRTDPTEERLMALFFDKAEFYSFFWLSYSALSGANVMVLTFRTVFLMGFQPRIGVVTNALRSALTDIFHFLLLFFVVAIGLSAVMVIIYGANIKVPPP
jgi:hypothetical protein